MITEHSRDLFGVASADLSDDGVYRYMLSRRWRPGPLVMFVMLNPSTADAFADDPTIRRCKGFAQREGFGALVVVNLYALRATNPRALVAHPDPVGPDNDAAIAAAATEVDDIICAWGGSGPAKAVGRGASVCGLLLGANREAAPMCFGTTRGGAPRHPLYLPGNAELVPYEFAEAIYG